MDANNLPFSIQVEQPLVIANDDGTGGSSGSRVIEVNGLHGAGVPIVIRDDSVLTATLGPAGGGGRSRALRRLRRILRRTPLGHECRWSVVLGADDGTGTQRARAPRATCCPGAPLHPPVAVNTHHETGRLPAARRGNLPVRDRGDGISLNMPRRRCDGLEDPYRAGDFECSHDACARCPSCVRRPGEGWSKPPTGGTVSRTPIHRRTAQPGRWMCATLAGTPRRGPGPPSPARTRAATA